MIVDDDIYQVIGHIHWCAIHDGRVWYAGRQIPVNGKSKWVKVHHVVAGYPLGGKVIDHINGDGLDNRRENLRITSLRVNNINRYDKRTGLASSKYPGVCWYKIQQKWVARIMVNGHSKCLGYFNSETKAAEAYRREFSKIEEVACV